MNKFKVNISGMTCTGCEKHVESALEKIGAKNIESSYRCFKSSNIVSIRFKSSICFCTSFCFLETNSNIS